MSTLMRATNNEPVGGIPKQSEVKSGLLRVRLDAVGTEMMTIDWTMKKLAEVEPGQLQWIHGGHSGVRLHRALVAAQLISSILLSTFCGSQKPVSRQNHEVVKAAPPPQAVAEVQSLCLSALQPGIPQHSRRTRVGDKHKDGSCELGASTIEGDFDTSVFSWYFRKCIVKMGI